jgi:predicted RecB family nuclease
LFGFKRKVAKQKKLKERLDFAMSQSVKRKPVKNEILGYAQKNFSHKNILSADLRKCQLDSNGILDKMPFVSDDKAEMVRHYKCDTTKLALVDGVTSRIEESLIESGIETIEELKGKSLSELMLIKGIDKKTAEKMLNSISDI